ncbi:hypothetical protein [Bacillus cereus]|uniref:hypothetical protein n=1 Tax=Bacillus cereus TaxID=1396 RepID=UPI0021119889|nr:hypothetical protein [Bacillus cereus]
MYTTLSYKKFANSITYKETKGVGIKQNDAQIERYRPAVYELLANDQAKHFELLLVQHNQEKTHTE